MISEITSTSSARCLMKNGKANMNEEEFKLDDEEDFADFDIDSTDPLYELSLFCEDKDHNLIEEHDLGEFQYLDEFANGALEAVKSDIETIYENFDDDRIKFITIEMNTVVKGEVIENVERIVYEF